MMSEVLDKMNFKCSQSIQIQTEERRKGSIIVDEKEIRNINLGVSSMEGREGIGKEEKNIGNWTYVYLHLRKGKMS